MEGNMDAGQRAYRITRTTDVARWKARGGALLVEAATEQGSPNCATMRATCERVLTVVHDRDSRLIDPPEDEDGVYVIRSGSSPALRETMDAIWAEGNRIAKVEELSKQLQQLAEDDLGVAAVHQLWEQITDYHR
jgi:hypothetical protein